MILKLREELHNIERRRAFVAMKKAGLQEQMQARAPTRNRTGRRSLPNTTSTPEACERRRGSAPEAFSIHEVGEAESTQVTDSGVHEWEHGLDVIEQAARTRDRAASLRVHLLTSPRGLDVTPFADAAKSLKDTCSALAEDLVDQFEQQSARIQERALAEVPRAFEDFKHQSLASLPRAFSGSLAAVPRMLAQ